ncbi:uncharacterized protein LOC101861279 [Aplysia californica]|uniref:Uncharacterized protein LOC101861279 n=1 Tax=Aplysia californica TaxID=6500 RepID=A0ABM0JNM6_APLCA|nr:uncharacterized protein LOC101861279 [Aplysia californica]
MHFRRGVNIFPEAICSCSQTGQAGRCSEFNTQRSEMEAERPQGYREYQSGDTSWDALGMRIKWTVPEVPGESVVHMLDPLCFKLCLECKKPVPLRDVSAWAWTCLYHTDNSEGIYREIRLPYVENSRQWDDNGVTTYLFSAVVFPTHTDDFRLTYNIKFRDSMIWVDKFQTDHIVTVLRPREVNQWTKQAEMAKITNRIFIGNFLSVILAEELNFEAVITLDKHLQGTAAEGVHAGRVKEEFHNFALEIGAGHEIPRDKVDVVVKRLKTLSDLHAHILMGDLDGQGRVGSAMTAYIFANNPHLTYEEACEFVKSQKMIYCHRGLKSTLHDMYPRD